MKVLITEKEIRDKVSELAEEIAKDYSCGHLHAIFVLKGAFIFCADLVRALSDHNVDVTVDYAIAKSYIGTESSGHVKSSVEVDVEGKEVLLVEDILDTGRTIEKLKDELKKRRANSVKTVCLLDKPSRREVDMKADYVGFEIPDKFVVGYGLDCDERYRHLRYIGVID
jgi:hypoxanthine phosphoribosyltransferase